MRYLALVTDYDGTIASKGRASAAALHAIARLRASGRRSILVTSSNAVVSLSPSIRSLSKMGSPACDCIAAIPDRYFLPRRRHAGGRSPMGQPSACDLRRTPRRSFLPKQCLTPACRFM